jgi:hypothetical protein
MSTSLLVRVAGAVALASLAGACGGESSGSSVPDVTDAIQCWNKTVQCDDTSAVFELRAFIPTTLPGASPPNGPWLEPGGSCEFYGDGRDFSTQPSASSRLHDLMRLPTLPPGQCSTEGASGAAWCSASHRRCLQNGSWQMDPPETATAGVEQSFACDGGVLVGHQKATANYPYILLSPAISDALEVTTWTSSDDNSITQHYVAQVTTTPFPDHEIVVTACGQTYALCQYATPFAGPWLNNLNLGWSQAEAVQATVEFDVQRTDTQTDAGTQADAGAQPGAGTQADAGAQLDSGALGGPEAGAGGGSPGGTGGAGCGEDLAAACAYQADCPSSCTCGCPPILTSFLEDGPVSDATVSVFLDGVRIGTVDQQGNPLGSELEPSQNPAHGLVNAFPVLPDSGSHMISVQSAGATTDTPVIVYVGVADGRGFSWGTAFQLYSSAAQSSHFLYEGDGS